MIRKVDLESGITSSISIPVAIPGSGAAAEAVRLTDRSPFNLYRRNGVLLLTYIGSSIIRRADGEIGVITTVAGTGTAGYSGDGGPATEAQLNYPTAVTLDSRGNVLIADSNNYVVRCVDAETGVIRTVAGTGTAGYSGDGGPATDARLGELGGLAITNTDDIVVVDIESCTLRCVDAETGVIRTVAGTGTAGYSGDGGPATEAQLNYPISVAVDEGAMYIVEAGRRLIPDNRRGRPSK